MSKPALSKAISTSKLSATRREDGSWAIDPAELCRYVEANGHRFHPATGNGSRVETPDDTASATATAAQVEALHQVEILLRQELPRAASHDNGSIIAVCSSNTARICSETS